MLACAFGGLPNSIFSRYLGHFAERQSQSHKPFELEVNAHDDEVNSAQATESRLKIAA
jgi:hypothetical protein